MLSLYEIALQFSGQLEPAAVRQTIVNESARLFDADASVFLTYDSNEGVLRFSEVIGNLEQYKDLTLQPGQGVAGIAFQEGRPFRVDNYATWEKRTDKIARGDIRAALGVPLIAAQGTVGVLFLTRKAGSLPLKILMFAWQSSLPHRQPWPWRTRACIRKVPSAPVTCSSSTRRV
jgi:GAF domain-containing protein